jgi:putative acetyltransferase
MIAIRQEQPIDREAISLLHESAFNGKGEAEVVRLLTDAKKAVVSLVAIAEEKIVGHVLFSRVTLSPDAKELRVVGLAPVSVLPQHHGQGIGSQLIRNGLGACRSSGFHAAVVLGSTGYYSRFGFIPASSYNLASEYDAGDHFMALELVPDSLSGIEALVKYEPEFAILGT